MDITAAPVTGTTPKTGLVSLRIPASLHTQLSELADLEGVSLNYYLGLLLATGLNSPWVIEKLRVIAQSKEASPVAQLAV